MNTCSRHESTGLPGKIHCSTTTAEQLQSQYVASNYSIIYRGLVEMKGKGKQLTYWLSGSQQNKLVNEQALEQLTVEVKELLAKTDFGSKLDGADSSSKAMKTARTTVSSPVPGGMMAAMERAAMETYIEEEVSRRLQESTVSDRMNLDHAEDTGLLREAKMVDDPEQEVPPPEQALVVCPKEKKSGRNRAWRLRKLRLIYV
jgi:hypothetical protein